MAKLAPNMYFGTTYEREIILKTFDNQLLLHQKLVLVKSFTQHNGSNKYCPTFFTIFSILGQKWA